MKSVFKAIFAVIFSIIIIQTSQASAQETSTLTRPRTEFGSEFWAEVRQLIEKCAVQTVAFDLEGRKVQGPLRSACAEIQVSDNGVAFELHGERYFAFLEESEFSDDGDLFNVIVQDAHGEVVAYRSEAVAFGDVLLGLAGHLNGMPEVLDPTLLI